jgi:hypothetical protein
MLPAGFEPAILAGERLQTHTATGIGVIIIIITSCEVFDVFQKRIT